MRVDDLFCNGKSQARPAASGGSLVIGLVEFVEDPRQLLRRYPGAGIADSHADGGVAFWLDREGH